MDLILIHHPSELPHFTNEEEEAAFWDTHGFAEDFPFLTEPATGHTAELLRKHRTTGKTEPAQREAH